MVKFGGRFADFLLVPCVGMLLRAMCYAAERVVVLQTRCCQGKTGWVIFPAAKA